MILANQHLVTYISMSTAPNQNAISSMSSVISSIENDRQIYRWFLILISLPQIQQKISVNDQIKEKYSALKRIQITEIVIYMLLILITICSYLIKQPWFLLWGILPIVILVNLFRKNRGCVAVISEQFLQDNINLTELNQQTLYQTCEYLSKEYKIPSLVDIITFGDFIGRKVLLGAVLFIPFIFPFNTGQILIACVIVLLATIAIVNTSLVLRRIK